MTIVCAIHQPNFFPWLGFFDKISKADTFIFMDSVAFPKSSRGTWINRVKLDVQGNSKWITCPIRRPSGNQPIHQVEINTEQPWQAKFLKTLQANYRKAPGFDRAFSFLRPLIEYETHNLAEFNINAILRCSEALGINAKFVRQSDLMTTEKSTKLLIEISKAVGAATYLAGGGAEGYQDDDLFGDAGLHLLYQNFEPEPYASSERWISGLSVIDFLMWAPDQWT